MEDGESKKQEFLRDFSRFYTGSANLGGKTSFPISFLFLTGFPGNFPVSYFSYKNGIRSVYTVYGVGRYGIFPFPLSSLLTETETMQQLSFEKKTIQQLY